MNTQQKKQIAHRMKTLTTKASIIGVATFAAVILLLAYIHQKQTEQIRRKHEMMMRKDIQEIRKAIDEVQSLNQQP